MEFDQLTDCYESKTADFIVIYGRRRLGKSEFIRQSIADRDDSVYYQAVESTAQNQREQFVETATAQFPSLQNVRRDWEALLAALGEEDAIVIIDEFPFLIDLITAKELREEADDHLEKLRDALDVGDGDIIEIDGETPS